MKLKVSLKVSRIREYGTCKDDFGIPALRNKAARVSNGRFTAVHDDDDIMTPVGQ